MFGPLRVHAGASPGSPRTRSVRRLRAGALASCTALLLTACGSEAPDFFEVSSAPFPSGSAPASAGSAAPPAKLAGITVANGLGGFATPWDLRFLPDGTPLVTERPGQLTAILDGRRTVVADVPDVVAAGEGGLMGMAIDPDFDATRHIYLCYAAGSGGSVRDVRVVRYRLADDLDAISEPTALVTGIPAGAGNRHLGCRLEVGPDGMLWITTGDAVQPAAPQDPSSRAGKVLRAQLDGQPAADNPGGAWDPYVYTIGHRNIQGLAFRPEDGAPFSVEHGTNCDDEINLLRAGANYGWDPVGPGGSYAEGAPMTSPDIAGAQEAVWSSGCPTIAPSGAEFIVDQQWGPWSGALAVAVLKDKQLLLVQLEGDSAIRTRVELDGDIGRLRTVRNGPDGSLWLTADASSGAVVRVVPET